MNFLFVFFIIQGFIILIFCAPLHIVLSSAIGMDFIDGHLNAYILLKTRNLAYKSPSLLPSLLHLRIPIGSAQYLSFLSFRFWYFQVFLLHGIALLSSQILVKI